MKQLDLRQVGTILGLPLYVDVAGVRELVERKTPNSKLVIGERDRKVILIQKILNSALSIPKGKVKS